MHWQEKWLIWLHTRYKAVYLPNIIIIYFFTDIWLNCAPVQGLINVKCTVMWLEYVRLLPSSKYCVKYGVDWLEHWIFHMFSVISAFEVCHCQPLKKIYTRGRIICNWLYSIGTPEVFWHLNTEFFICFQWLVLLKYATASRSRKYTQGAGSSAIDFTQLGHQKCFGT